MQPEVMFTIYMQLCDVTDVRRYLWPRTYNIYIYIYIYNIYIYIYNIIPPFCLTFRLLPFSETLLYISVNFHNSAHSVSTTFYKVYEYIKTSQTEFFSFVISYWPIRYYKRQISTSLIKPLWPSLRKCSWKYFCAESSPLSAFRWKDL